jgi:hypothetical protein
MSYDKCLNTKRSSTGLCARGYCTAKEIFKTYPSAYANGYASMVCQGKKPDYQGKTYTEASYMKKLSKQNLKGNELNRWFNEKWVNVCKKGKGAGGYAPCGRKSDSMEKYPYCRPYYKLPGTPVKTARELTVAEKKRMCFEKTGPKRVYIKLK